MIDILLHGCQKFNDRDNKEILLHTIDYIKSSKRFERALIDHCLLWVYFIIIFIICFSHPFFPFFRMLTFFPNWNECLTFRNFIRIVTAFSNF